MDTTTSSPFRDLEARGFSLIEALVALMLLAFVVLGILGSLDYGVRLNGSSRDYTAISNHAKSQLEELLALGFNDSQLTAGVTYQGAVEDGLYRLEYRVDDYIVSSATPDPAAVLAAAPQAPGAPNINMKRITVTASAVAPGPGLRTVTVEAVKHVR